ncbi:MAG: TonB-dependent receptor domain-containing protein, partial [Acidobacteriota bacterium]
MLAGTSAYLNHVDYQIAQPLGEQSPLSTNPANSDADSFSPNFLDGETGSWAEATVHPTERWSAGVGGRIQTFALGGHITATPRLYSSFRVSSHTAFHAAFGEYAQMPPAIYMTSWPQNYQLLPIRAAHVVVGADLYTTPCLRFGVEAYQKSYRDYPVSAEYPSLSLANMIDELGQQFLWLPLSSRGRGLARGAEVTAALHLGSHLSGQANIAYARTEFAGLDSIARPGNFDYPIVGNTSGT